MKTIIAGSRSITDMVHVERAIELSGFVITCVVSGRAAGVDTLGEVWAESRGIPIIKKPADWKRFGKAAGFRRNAEMGNEADAAVIVWDGFSHGSAHMYKVMKQLKKPVFLYNPFAPSLHGF